ncbi:MAG: hypothetical protein ABI476_03930 [Oxalobacteraceae bacterium]
MRREYFDIALLLTGVAHSLPAPAHRAGKQMHNLRSEAANGMAWAQQMLELNRFIPFYQQMVWRVFNQK